VYTGVTLVYRDAEGAEKAVEFAEKTLVKFADISGAEINAYLDTGEYADKAGSYAIQGVFSRHIERIEGDYNNVVGFPVARIYAELAKM
ncbi:MAG: Maf family protein, partial [Clostridia bacterium]|nr:Maf family protein [Clostridia bacterium]